MNPLVRGIGRALTGQPGAGLRCHLLADPGREFHVLDLAAPTLGQAVVADLGAAIDPTARAAYRRRVDGLRSAMDDAEASGDADQKAHARQELEFIEHELAAAYGLSGTARRPADPAERPRKAVTNRIRDAMSRIEANHPALGRHLRTSIRTGTFCSYEPERSPTWGVRSTC